MPEQKNEASMAGGNKYIHLQVAGGHPGMRITRPHCTLFGFLVLIGESKRDH